MKKAHFLLYLSLMLFSSCIVFKGKEYKDLKAKDKKNQETISNLNKKITDLQGQIKDIEKISAKAKKYDEDYVPLLEKFSKAVILRDSLLKENKMLKEKNEKLLKDSVNLAKALVEISIKKNNLETLKDALQLRVDECDTQMPLLKACCNQGRLLPNAPSHVAKEEEKKLKEKK